MSMRYYNNIGSEALIGLSLSFCTLLVYYYYLFIIYYIIIYYINIIITRMRMRI